MAVELKSSVITDFSRQKWNLLVKVAVDSKFMEAKVAFASSNFATTVEHAVEYLVH